MSVKFVKKYFHRKTFSKSTSRQSTSKRSLISVKFANKDFHGKTFSKSTLTKLTLMRLLFHVDCSDGDCLSVKTFFGKIRTNERESPRAHHSKPPQREASWVNFVRKDFHRKAVTKCTSWQSTSTRSLMSVKFAKTDLHRKAISITIQKDWGYVPIEIAFLWRYVLAKFTLMRLLSVFSVKDFFCGKNRRQCVELENSDCRVKAICRYYGTYTSMCIFVPGGTELQNRKW